MRPWTLTVLACSGVLTVSCAHLPRSWRGAVPQVDMPLEAATPCTLYILPDHPTQADLDLGYVRRGAQLVACDAARDLAVRTFRAQQDLLARPKAGPGRGP